MALSDDKVRQLQKLLSNLESHTELEATAVVTIEGMRIACAVSGDLDADVYSAASAALVNLGETTLKQLQHGSLKEIIVRGDDGYTILTRAGSSNMVVGSCKIGSRMGYYLALLHRFCKKVQGVVEGGFETKKPSAPAVTSQPPASDLSASKQPRPGQMQSPPSQPVVPSIPAKTTTPTRVSRDKEAVESALDALSMMEETEPPSSAAEEVPLVIDEPTPVQTQAPSESRDLEDALKTLGASDEPAPTGKVDVDTNVLIDALKPSSAAPEKKVPTSEPTQSSEVPFTSSGQTQQPSKSASSDDIFNISDKEAVLEALKVLGWEEDEED
ncbi:MAG: hypothetical protein EU549_01195 [Promethearchaeota archaeon]|nr:MAG: hypothetical protein EU549_01195 [Candidatus Lokiarchaeota archaeon]